MTETSAELISETVDVVVVGSGVGGLATAVTAALKGLSVLVLEKDALFGGTSARSGGVLWIPDNGKFPEGEQPPGADARQYLRQQTGSAYDHDRVSGFLAAGPRMVAFMEANTSAVRFIPAHGFSDYHPHEAGAVTTGRSIAAEPYDGRGLGAEIARLRPPLAEITLLGMMLNASEDVKHLFNVTKSAASFRHVAKLVRRYARDLLLHRRAMRLTNGNALVARLARSLFDLGAHIRTSCAVEALITDEDGRVVGVEVRDQDKRRRIHARRGVVLAAGGFPMDMARRATLFPHEVRGGEHLSPAPEANSGDGIALGESVGARFSNEVDQPAAWIPVSLVPDPRRRRVFPHLIDRYKPGVIMVNRKGCRFTNEADSYHDVGKAMLQDREPDHDVHAWVICDHRAIRKYGLGFVKPSPFLLGSYLRSGYLRSGKTPQALAIAIGVDPDALAATIASYNADAVHGNDPLFRRGQSSYNRFLGDREHRPNPCVAALQDGPYYAIRVVLGDLGTFAGLTTDARSRVLRADRSVIAGLYAVGNDALSVMGGNYPGGGITLGPAMTFGFIAAEDMAAASVPSHHAFANDQEKNFVNH